MRRINADICFLVSVAGGLLLAGFGVVQSHAYLLCSGAAALCIGMAGRSGRRIATDSAGRQTVVFARSALNKALALAAVLLVLVAIAMKPR